MVTIQLEKSKSDDCWILTAPSAQHLSLPNLETSWFVPERLNSDLTLTGQAQGRGTTYFMQYQQQQLVLRHYRRGGLVGKVIQDSFLYTGMHNTRPYRELQLLEQLTQWGLPSPKPIGGRVTRKGLWWRGDLLSELIPNASDVHQVLRSRALSEFEWRHVGATIRRFHNKQVFHHDLNIHNIMLDSEGQAWLIDFDKCGIRSGEGWKQANLERLLRSLRKEKQQSGHYYFEEDVWRFLIEGYRG